MLTINSVLSADQLLFFLIAGFSFGIVCYQIILFWCTRALIYLHFSMALFFYTLGIGQWGAMWHITEWPQESVSLVLDTFNLILLSSFIKQFCMLFVDFKRLYPLITRAVDAYIWLGGLLILVYLLYPHPLLLTIRSLLILVACITGVVTILQSYPAITQLYTFAFTLMLLFFISIYFHSFILYSEVSQLPLLFYSGWLFSGMALFVSFSSLITRRFNEDYEQRIITQKTAIESLQKYQELYQNALEGLFTACPDGSLLEANPALNKLLNIPALNKTPITQTFLHHYFAEPQETWNKIIRLLALHNAVEGLEVKGQDSFWYNLSARRTKANHQEIIEGSLIDISQRKQQELQLSYLASHDALTNLSNRNEFENYLQDAIRSQGVHTLLFIDLDQFKVINDTCGHAAGDECLRQVAAIFKTHIGSHDMLARLGGDEFGIVFWDQNRVTGKTNAERLRLALEANHFQWLQRVFKTSVSIGLITIDEHINCGEQALSLADAACYEAKSAGRNRIVINEPHKSTTVHRHKQMDMVATLTQALRDQQLILFQQPIVSLATTPSTHLLHYEVLVRLRTDSGLINPGDFLPAAHRYGLLSRIDRWVFKRTCMWLAEEDNLARTGMVNINISPQTLADNAFMIFVRNCIAEYGILPAKICFEITEDTALSNFTLVLHHILKLRGLGFRFALDDFGSGFASFDHVKRLPVDFIKIDGQFIKKLTHDTTNQILVQAVTEISHTLGKQVIAESIEDESTADILREYNIDFGQGYHLGRPAPLYVQQSQSTCEISYAL